VPRTGHFPPPFGPAADLFQIGLLARFVEDLSLTLPLIAGPDGRDEAITTMPFPDPKSIPLKNRRVAFYTENGIVSPTAETVTAVRAAANALTAAGMNVEEARPPRVEETYEFFIFSFIVSAALEGWGGRHWGQRLIEVAGTREVDLHPYTQRWLQAQRSAATRRGNDHPIPIAPGKWSGFRTGIISFLEKYDAVLCPVSASPAPPHGTLWNDDKLPAFSYAMTYGLTGMPSVVIRGGTSPEGLPIGIQVVVAPSREDVALAVAQQIETALGGWKPPQI
jgi:amidase